LKFKKIIIFYYSRKITYDHITVSSDKYYVLLMKFIFAFSGKWLRCWKPSRGIPVAQGHDSCCLSEIIIPSLSLSLFLPRAMLHHKKILTISGLLRSFLFTFLFNVRRLRSSPLHIIIYEREREKSTQVCLLLRGLSFSPLSRYRKRRYTIVWQRN